MAGPQQISLIKYGKPEVLAKGLDGAMPSIRFLNRVAQDQQAQQSAGCGSVTDPVLLELMQFACKEAALSQIDKDQILEAIIPPREWEEDGKRYQQLISKDPATRADVSGLSHLLNEQLTLRQARPDGICLIRRELAEQCFDELIRQITLSQAERGLLLLRVRDELRMTLTAYQNLFVSGRDHDPRKTVASEIMAMKQELTTKYNELAAGASSLEKEKQDLNRTFENQEQIFREERESSNKSHHVEFQFLKRINNTLKQQIDAMNDPDNDIDPVIDAYESIPIQQTRGIWKYTKVCKESETVST